jgi:hypothetical protein
MSVDEAKTSDHDPYLSVRVGHVEVNGIELAVLMDFGLVLGRICSDILKEVGMDVWQMVVCTYLAQTFLVSYLGISVTELSGNIVYVWNLSDLNFVLSNCHRGIW